jgi:hypothetical protein
VGYDIKVFQLVMAVSHLSIRSLFSVAKVVNPSDRFVTARIHIPPYAPYSLVFVPIVVINPRDHALMRYDIVEGFCSYLCSRACEVV